MKRSFKYCLSLSLTLMAHLTGSAKALSLSEDKTGPSLRLSVRVFNYAQVSPETWNLARKISTSILGRTGIQTFWLECSLSSEGNFTIPACAQSLGSSDLVLRLVPVSAATRGHFGSGTLGIAAQPERGTPASASVFYDRLEQLAKGGTASVSVILGHAVAHEIGHLLLGSNSHTPQGLMRDRWSRQDLQNAGVGYLLFTTEQAEAIRAETLRRLQ
jgi:hypothetical protein